MQLEKCAHSYTALECCTYACRMETHLRSILMMLMCLRVKVKWHSGSELLLKSKALAMSSIRRQVIFYSGSCNPKLVLSVSVGKHDVCANILVAYNRRRIELCFGA